MLRTYVIDVTTEHFISSHECSLSDWSCILGVTCFFISVFAKPHFNIFEFIAALASKVPPHVAVQTTWIVRWVHVWGFQPTGSQTCLMRPLPVSLSSGSWLWVRSQIRALTWSDGLETNVCGSAGGRDEGLDRRLGRKIPR